MDIAKSKATRESKRRTGDGRAMDSQRLGESGFVTNIGTDIAGNNRGKGNQMKSDILALAASELCDPVACLQGCSALLLQDQPEASVQRELLSVISVNSAALSSIIGDLGVLSGLVLRQVRDFIFSSTDVRSLLPQLVGLFSTPEERDAPVLQVPKHPLLIMADSNKLAQAVTRALDHVYRRSPSGASVCVAVSARSVGEAGGGGPRLIGLSVFNHDGGGGMQALKRAGGRRRAAFRSGGAPAMGLGMSVVREIMRIHGGQLQLGRNADGGNSVTMLLPEVIRPAVARARKAAYASRAR